MQKHALAVLITSLLTLSFSPSTLANVVPVAGCSAKAVADNQRFDAQIRNNTLAISPDEKIAVVANSERSEIIIYDLTTGKIRETLQGYLTPRNILFSPDGDYFYISDSSLGKISKIETATLKNTLNIAAGPGVFGTAISKDGKSLYANNQASSTVSHFSSEYGIASAVIQGFSQPRQGVKLSPDGKLLLVTNFVGDKITLVDTNSDSIVGEITGFNKIRAISITADGKTVFAANSGSDSIAVVDVATRKIVKTIAVGKEPYGAALTPDGKFLYSGNLADNSLSVIDVASLAVTKTVTGLNGPRQAIAFSKDNQSVWVLNADLSLVQLDRQSHSTLKTVQ
ncbi:YVTN family beta-propeller repeat protein [Candidatus Pantoea multigeneris]|uniref:Beta-propeller fold lactonase family protein n=1 Tax=Candidatus Pantoea multigeneris TaxID=2608357 RepID=A0ABX0RAU7_9GAMM|nr:beta-propeller fold lactonase family protein [Pantoea multigeneris]NIF22492.1 beta-propeller fold lactonase family protein [Pantoea multigeneris]